MAAVTFEQVLSDLKKRLYRPIYFFMGDEPFFIDQLTEYIEEHVLNEAEKSFNLTVLYGKETDLPTLVSLAKRYPMMANYQVIILKEAQTLKNLDASEIGKKTNPLLIYAQEPLSSTILVIAYKGKKLEKNKKLYKAIESKGVIFDSKKIYDDKLPAWITKQLQQRGKKIELAAAVLMADFIGNNLSAIENEINKMLIFLENQQLITVKDVEKLIGVSKEYSISELLNAISYRNVTQANKIILYFAANPKENPVQKIIVWIFDFFQKVLLLKDISRASDQELATKLGVNPYFLTNYRVCSQNYTRDQLIRIIHIIREYDVKCKGVDSLSEPHELLKEMVFKILN